MASSTVEEQKQEDEEEEDDEDKEGPQEEPEENMFLPECEITGSAALIEYTDIHCPKLRKHYDNLPRLKCVYL